MSSEDAIRLGFMFAIGVSIYLTLVMLGLSIGIILVRVLL